MNSSHELLKEVRKLMRNDDFPAVFELVEDFYEGKTETDAIFIQSLNFNRNNKLELKGTLSRKEFDRELNKIRSNILNFIRHNEVNVKEDSDIEKEIPFSIRAFKKQYRDAAITIKVSNLLVENYKKGQLCNLRSICAICNIKNRPPTILFLKDLEMAEYLEKSKVNNIDHFKLCAKGFNFFNNFK